MWPSAVMADCLPHNFQWNTHSLCTLAPSRVVELESVLKECLVIRRETDETWA